MWNEIIDFVTTDRRLAIQKPRKKLTKMPSLIWLYCDDCDDVLSTWNKNDTTNIWRDCLFIRLKCCCLSDEYTSISIFSFIISLRGRLYSKKKKCLWLYGNWSWKRTASWLYVFQNYSPFHLQFYDALKFSFFSLVFFCLCIWLLIYISNRARMNWHWKKKIFCWFADTLI